MSLTKQLLHKIDDSTRSQAEQARLRCRLAKELEESGDYEAARSAMGELWQRVGERPQLDGLDRRTAAEVLLRAGSLTGWIGSLRQLAGSQETAKNLISESLTIFETVPDSEKAAEAQTDLAYCYWREGALDEARIMLRAALERLADANNELKAIILLRSAIVEKVATRLNDALSIHHEAAPLFAVSNNNVLKGKFHNEFGTVLKNLGAAEQRRDYIDRALIEFAAASFYFEQAGHTRYWAYVENNLGMLLLTDGKFGEAHEHLDRARRMFVSLKDGGQAAQVDETRARALLAEGRVAEAEAVVRAAVRVFEKGDEQSLLAEALTTHAIALARLGRFAPAHLTFTRAREVAELAGDREGAGQATLAALEELREQLALAESIALYECAADWLAHSQHPGIRERLIQCACVALRRLSASRRDAPVSASAAIAEEADTAFDWQGFCLKDEVLRHERQLIERALRDAGGSVTRAAQLLGFKHHQTFIALLNNRHRSLLAARTPAVSRKRSIIRMRGTHHAAHSRVPVRVRPATILYVEDDSMVRATLKETLELEGWQIEECADGISALQKLESRDRYDLLLFDHTLPGVTGLELARRARNFPHRRATPIVMLSAEDMDGEARRAGVDRFLQKPRDLLSVVETITRLLDTPEER